MSNWSWPRFCIGYAKGGAIGVALYAVFLLTYWTLRWLV